MSRPVTRPKKPDEVVTKIRRTRGLSVRVAEACGIQREAVYQWTKVPAQRVYEVADLLGVPVEQVRPDIFRHLLTKSQRAKLKL